MDHIKGVVSMDWGVVKKLFDYRFEPVTGGMPVDDQRGAILRNYAVFAKQVEDGVGDWKRMDPYTIADWATVLSEIDFGAWQDIRAAALPLWPRLPVGGITVSFGNPAAKIALLCSAELARIDDATARAGAWLRDTGWTLATVTGQQCTNVMESPAEMRERTGDVPDGYEERYRQGTLAGAIADLQALA